MNGCMFVYELSGCGFESRHNVSKTVKIFKDSFKFEFIFPLQRPE